MVQVDQKKGKGRPATDERCGAYCQPVAAWKVRRFHRPVRGVGSCLDGDFLQLSRLNPELFLCGGQAVPQPLIDFQGAGHGFQKGAGQFLGIGGGRFAKAAEASRSICWRWEPSSVANVGHQAAESLPQLQVACRRGWSLRVADPLPEKTGRELRFCRGRPQRRRQVPGPVKLRLRAAGRRRQKYSEPESTRWSSSCGFFKPAALSGCDGLPSRGMVLDPWAGRDGHPLSPQRRSNWSLPRCLGAGWLTCGRAGRLQPRGQLDAELEQSFAPHAAS